MDKFDLIIINEFIMKHKNLVQHHVELHEEITKRLDACVDLINSQLPKKKKVYRPEIIELAITLYLEFLKENDL